MMTDKDKQKINAEKAALRKIYKEKRASLTLTEAEAQDAELRRLILSSEQYKNAKTILLYYPLKNETNVFPIMRAAASDGKRVAFPRCEKRGKMTFYYIESEDGFELGSYGIKEPRLDLTPVSEADLSESVCVVPGLVFDSDGFRIGYGGGYYDRFLKTYGGFSIAPVRRGFLSRDKLPRDEYDQKCDKVVYME